MDKKRWQKANCKERRKKRFIRRIATDAYINCVKTYETNGKKASILRYKEKDYAKIKKWIREINDITVKNNIAVSVDGSVLKKNEVRFSFID